MKKFIVSSLFIAAIAGFMAYRSYDASQEAYTATDTASQQQTPAGTADATVSGTTSPAQTPASDTTASQTPVAMPNSKYKDGTYTGSTATTYYGPVQVKVTITNGKLVDVTFLQYPTERGTSQQISADVMPKLVSEALKAQSAQVNGVSGASEISTGFVQSLSSALAKAAN